MKQIKYITYTIIGMHKNNTPIAVDCSQITRDEAVEIYKDADSLHGIGQVRGNFSGVIRKDRIVITPAEHYKYDWEILDKQYFDKMYNPDNF